MYIIHNNDQFVLFHSDGESNHFHNWDMIFSVTLLPYFYQNVSYQFFLLQKELNWCFLHFSLFKKKRYDSVSQYTHVHKIEIPEK